MQFQQKQQFQIGSLIPIPSPQFPQRRLMIISKQQDQNQEQTYLVQPQEWGNNKQNFLIKVTSQMQEQEKQFLQSLIKYQIQEDQSSQPHIVRIFELVENYGYFITIIESYGETLFDYTQNLKGRISLIEKIKILQQISQPVYFLHCNQLMHRNIKPESFAKVGDQFKLVDLDLVKQQQNRNTLNVGAQLFQAPEMKENQYYQFGVDVWSLGGTFYELLTEEQFSDQNLSKVQIKHFTHFSTNFDNELNICKDLLQNMLQKEPQKRIDINQVIQSLNTIEILLSQKLEQETIRTLTLNTSPNNRKAQFFNNVSIKNNFPLAPQIKNNNFQQSIGSLNQKDNVLNSLRDVSNLIELQFKNLTQTLQTLFEEKIKNQIQEQFTNFQAENHKMMEQQQQQILNVNNYLVESQKWFEKNKTLQQEETKQLIKEQKMLIDLNSAKTIEAFQQIQENNETIYKKLNDHNTLLLSTSKEWNEIQQNIKTLEQIYFYQNVEYQKGQEVQLKYQSKQFEELKSLLKNSILDHNSQKFNELLSQSQENIMALDILHQTIQQQKQTECDNEQILKKILVKIEEQKECISIQLNTLVQEFRESQSLMQNLSQTQYSQCTDYLKKISEEQITQKDSIIKIQSKFLDQENNVKQVFEEKIKQIIDINQQFYKSLDEVNQKSCHLKQVFEEKIKQIIGFNQQFYRSLDQINQKSFHFKQELQNVCKGLDQIQFQQKNVEIISDSSADKAKNMYITIQQRELKLQMIFKNIQEAIKQLDNFNYETKQQINQFEQRFQSQGDEIIKFFIINPQ